MVHNVIIIGSGIAGLTAGIYAARANLEPLIISGVEEGGQLTLTDVVENFPGFPEGIIGPKLVLQSRKQAEHFGATMVSDTVVSCVPQKDKSYVIQCESGKEYRTWSVIIATGARARWLGLDSELAYRGRGVTTCATCDGAFFKGKEVVVVGGGDSAMEEALFLTKFATKVTVIHRRDTLRASKIMQDRFFAHHNTGILWNKEIVAVMGNGKVVQGVELKDTITQALETFSCDGVFVAIGHIPNTKGFVPLLHTDAQGYLVTDRFMNTTQPGIFVAGDVQDSRYRQAITAAGSGCMAAMEAEQYLASNGHK